MILVKSAMVKFEMGVFGDKFTEDDKVVETEEDAAVVGKFGEREAFERFTLALWVLRGRRPFLIHALKLPCLLSGGTMRFAK